MLKHWPVQPCLKCEYDLRASLETGRCPECGWEFKSDILIVPAWRYQDWPRIWAIPYLVLTLGLILLWGWGLLLNTPVEWWIKFLSAAWIVYTMIELWKRIQALDSKRRGIAPLRFAVTPRNVSLADRKSEESYKFGHDIQHLERVRIAKRGKKVWRIRGYNYLFRAFDIVVTGDRRAVATLAGVLRRSIRELNKADSPTGSSARERPR